MCMDCLAKNARKHVWIRLLWIRFTLGLQIQYTSKVCLQNNHARGCRGTWMWAVPWQRFELTTIESQVQRPIITTGLPSRPCYLQHSLNGFFSRTNWVSQYQKNNHSGFYWSRDDGVAVASAGPLCSKSYAIQDFKNFCNKYLLWQFPNHKKVF